MHTHVCIHICTCACVHISVHMHAYVCKVGCLSRDRPLSPTLWAMLWEVTRPQKGGCAHDWCAEEEPLLCQMPGRGQGGTSLAARPGAQAAGVSGWGGGRAHPSTPLRVRSFARAGGWPGPHVPAARVQPLRRDNLRPHRERTENRPKAVRGAGWRRSVAGG